MGKPKLFVLTPIEPSAVHKEIIKAYDKTDKKIWQSTDPKITKVKKEIKDYYKDKQKFQCAWCRQKILVDNNRNWDAEHVLCTSIYPQFAFEPENLVASCSDCNGPEGKFNKDVLVGKLEKKDEYPTSKNSFSVLHPLLEPYSEHIDIKMIHEHRLYFSKGTPKGNKTFDVCNLKRFSYKYSGYVDLDDLILLMFDNFMKNLPVNTPYTEASKMFKFAIDTAKLKDVDF